MPQQAPGKRIERKETYSFLYVNKNDQNARIFFCFKGGRYHTKICGVSSFTPFFLFILCPHSSLRVCVCAWCVCDLHVRSASAIPGLLVFLLLPTPQPHARGLTRSLGGQHQMRWPTGHSRITPCRQSRVVGYQCHTLIMFHPNASAAARKKEEQGQTGSQDRATHGERRKHGIMETMEKKW